MEREPTDQRKALEAAQEKCRSLMVESHVIFPLILDALGERVESELELPEFSCEPALGEFDRHRVAEIGIRVGLGRVDEVLTGTISYRQFEYIKFGDKDYHRNAFYPSPNLGLTQDEAQELINTWDKAWRTYEELVGADSLAIEPRSGVPVLRQDTWWERPIEH